MGYNVDFKPITTAPMDGTVIMGLVERTPTCAVCVYWNAATKEWRMKIGGSARVKASTTATELQAIYDANGTLGPLQTALTTYIAGLNAKTDEVCQPDFWAPSRLQAPSDYK